MPKVVINKCFGGFHPSLKAQVMYLERKGKQAFLYETVKYSHQPGGPLIRKVDTGGRSLVSISTKDLGETATHIPDEHYFYYGDIARDDPDLVEVVEELGSAEASSSVSSLKVVDVPDDVNWYIDEYDGLEHVAEQHRVWG